MAERLAPEQTALLISSRPERPRGRAGRWIRRLLGLVITVAVLAGGTLATLHFLAIHQSAQEIRATALVPPEMPARVLVVLARPGQEVPMAGTLTALDRAGAEVSVLSLTRGEAQAPQIEEAGEGIAKIRADEMARAADMVGADSVKIAKYADGSVISAEPAEVTERIAKAITKAQPSTILTVSDTTGTDTDSQAVGAYALAAAQAEGSGVARVWTVTRGDREITWNALLSESMGQMQVPEPQVAVRIDEATTTKGEVLLAHGTQSPDLVAQSYPYGDRIPAWAYFRFWDREYFALTWGQPLE